VLKPAPKPPQPITNGDGERHRHRFEFNNTYREEFGKGRHGLFGGFPGRQVDGNCEVKDHPYMIASQFHPEVLSRPPPARAVLSGWSKPAAERAKARGKQEVGARRRRAPTKPKADYTGRFGKNNSVIITSGDYPMDSNN